MAVNSARGSAWNKIREQVLIRDSFICNYCGNEATEADHVLPRSKGGTDTMDNLVSACRSCNGKKSDNIDGRNTWYSRDWLDRL